MISISYKRATPTPSSTLFYSLLYVAFPYLCCSRKFRESVSNQTNEEERETENENEDEKKEKESEKEPAAIVLLYTAMQHCGRGRDKMM